MKLKFVILCLLAIAFGQIFARLGEHQLLYWFITLPGTVMHEVLHYGTAFVLGGNPSGFSLIPSGNKLGSVIFAPNWYNTATVALSPILLLPISVLCITYAAMWKSILSVLGWTYISACLWAAAIPSTLDVQVALGMPSSWPFAIVLLGIISFYTAKGIQRRLDIE